MEQQFGRKKKNNTKEKDPKYSLGKTKFFN